MNWSVRVVGSGRRRATAYARAHRFEVGAPVEFDEAAPAVSTLEYALAAVAAELAGTFTELARRRRIEVDGIEATANGELDNPLTWLEVVGEPGHPGLHRLDVKLYVISPADPAVLQALWERACALSPLVRTLSAAPGLDLCLELDISP
jgi:hypothetical protein